MNDVDGKKQRGKAVGRAFNGSFNNNTNVQHSATHTVQNSVPGRLGRPAWLGRTRANQDSRLSDYNSVVMAVVVVVVGGVV